MKRVFISQPMNGRSNRAILEEREQIISIAKPHIDGEFEVIDSVLDLGPASAIKYLAESIKLLDDADIVVMMRGWEKARGCQIEHLVASSYGRKIIYIN